MRVKGAKVVARLFSYNAVVNEHFNALMQADFGNEIKLDKRPILEISTLGKQIQEKGKSISTRKEKLIPLEGGWKFLEI